jgi:hypothetical protein
MKILRNVNVEMVSRHNREHVFVKLLLSYNMTKLQTLTSALVLYPTKSTAMENVIAMKEMAM